MQTIRIKKGAISRHISLIAFENMNRNVKNHGWERADGTLPVSSIIPEEILEFKKKKIEEMRRDDVVGAGEIPDEILVIEKLVKKPVKKTGRPKKRK